MFWLKTQPRGYLLSKQDRKGKTSRQKGKDIRVFLLSSLPLSLVCIIGLHKSEGGFSYVIFFLRNKKKCHVPCIPSNKIVSNCMYVPSPYRKEKWTNTLIWYPTQPLKKCQTNRQTIKSKENQRKKFRDVIKESIALYVSLF